MSIYISCDGCFINKQKIEERNERGKTRVSQRAKKQEMDKQVKEWAGKYCLDPKMKYNHHTTELRRQYNKQYLRQKKSSVDG